jgi:hypothetical protein
MTRIGSLAVGLGLVVCTTAGAQPAPGNTDLYHIHFTKAVPGQALQLGQELKKPDTTSSMPDHFIVLRHQEGDDWDYCVIQHLGPKATVDSAGRPADPARTMRAWHTDTFASGPSWAEVSKAFGIGDGASGTAGSVYNVQVWREAPGHRDQLAKALAQAGSGAKVPATQVVFQHVEGGPWTYIAVARYNSWQDFGTDQAAAADDAPWAELRAHSTYHHDTLADRITQR